MNWNRCPVCDRTHNRETILCGICGSIAMPENKNDWETIDIQHSIKPDEVYEFRHLYQRRKKAKVMPEMMRGDGIFTDEAIGVYMGTAVNHPYYSLNSISGINYKFKAEDVRSINRMGVEIWRREG